MLTSRSCPSRLQEQEARGAWCAPDDSWVVVRAGDTEPFSFGARARSRARPHASAAAPAPLHRLALRLDAWAPPHPVCVDRVGVFFRHVAHTVRPAPRPATRAPRPAGDQRRAMCSQKTGAEARLVFEVSLEGSARKLVTVRSALQIVNRLPDPVEVRVDHALPAGQLRRSAPTRRRVTAFDDRAVDGRPGMTRPCRPCARRAPVVRQRRGVPRDVPLAAARAGAAPAAAARAAARPRRAHAAGAAPLAY